MEPILGSSVCLICFDMTEKHIFVPPDEQENIFNNCNKYLHSTLTKGTLKDIELHNKNQVPLCKSCFDSALELTQLSEQLKTIEKDISDLSEAFSMAVFHRRSQVYIIGQNCKTSSIVEFNEAYLYPNLFSRKLGDQNINPNKNNQEMHDLHLQLQTDISNVKCEASDIQFDNLSGNPQQSVENDSRETQFKKENLDKQCEQPTIEENQNIATISEIRIVHARGRNDSKKCGDPNHRVEFTMSDLLKSVKMPKIVLERIKIGGHKLDISAGNSNQTKCESHQKNLDETLFKYDEYSVPSSAPKSSEDGKLLKCFYCEKTFAQESHRTLHHETHIGETIYKRPLGKLKFVYRSNQKIDKKTPSGKKPFYKCSYCEKAFSRRSNLQIHERNHTGEKPFKCSFCNFRVNNKSNLHSHERTHTGEKPFKCSFCNNGFTQSSTLKKHERTHTGVKQFKCSFCNKQFNNSGTLKRHESTHTGETIYKRPFDQMKFVYGINQKIDQNTPTGKKPFYKCSYCGKEFSAVRNLEIHERIHTLEKPFKCSFCSCRFNHKCSMTEHERIHTGEKPFKCSFCTTRFNQSSSLRRHERTHTGEKPFKCGFCNFRFTSNSNLKSHEKTHTGEKPFKCSFCSTRFNHKCRLTEHERIHTGEKPYNCSYCNKRFTKSSSLKNHEKTHTGEKPFKCSFCNKRFNQRINLKRHEGTHTGEKTFKCLSCGQCFSDKSNLKVHERLHTGEEPYKCSYCEKTFSGISGKNSHQKCHPEQISSLHSKFGNQNDDSLEDLKLLERVNSEGHLECVMTFSDDEERANHERIHRREEFIVGI